MLSQGHCIRTKLREAHLNLGLVMFRQMQLDEAERELITADQLAPHQPDILCDAGGLIPVRGQMALADGDRAGADACFARADAHFNEALLPRADFSPALIGLGLSLHAQGKGERSLFYLKEAERCDPALPGGSSRVRDHFGAARRPRSGCPPLRTGGPFRADGGYASRKPGARPPSAEPPAAPASR